MTDPEAMCADPSCPRWEFPHSPHASDVRERLAEVLLIEAGWESLTHYHETFSNPNHPFYENWLRKADAILSDSELVDALVRSRLEQVGTVGPDPDGWPIFCGTTPSDDRGMHVLVPVYRIKGETP